VQTFQPDATPLAFAARHDVAGFLAGELERRAVLGYPPFRHLVSIVVAGPSPGEPERALKEIRSRLEASARICSARRLSCGFVDGTEPSLSRRPRNRAGSREPRRRCSKRQRLPSVATG